MSSVPELACLLSSELDDSPDADTIAGLLAQLLELVRSQPDAARDLDELLFDLHVALCAAAGTSAPAEHLVRQLLVAAANKCTAREVFTLCMATLGQQLSCRHGEGAISPPFGPASPEFQLFLLQTLRQCLPRIKRHPLHFLAELLHMQLRWAAEVLPSLGLGDPAAAATAAASTTTPGPGLSQGGGQQQQEGEAQVTVSEAVASLAALASSTADWVQQAGPAMQDQQQQGQQKQLSAQEQQPARQLLCAALLQLASITIQLPQVMAAGAAQLPSLRPGASVAAATPGPTAPTAGSRIPLMAAAGEQLMLLPGVLLRQLLADGPFPTPAEPGSLPGTGAGGGSSAGSVPGLVGSSRGSSPEALWQLAHALDTQLSGSGLDPDDLQYFSAAEAAEGAAVATCIATCSCTPSEEARPQLVRKQAARLQQLLPQAACLLLDLGAQHQSAALTLLPLHTLCCASSQVAAAPECQLAASSAPLATLLSSLVAIMSHNPVQLLRSCAHDALHAVLDAFQPPARLAQLQELMQMPSTAAPVVALQRLRQEMAAAWADPHPASSTEHAQGQGKGQEGGSSTANTAGTASTTPWLTSEALQLALACLEHGAEGGWHSEADVLSRADVQAAALSLLRWVLLREAAAPRGLLPAQQAQRLLQHGLLPLQACVLLLLQMQMQMQAGDMEGRDDSSGGGSSGEAALWRQYQLDSFLAVQRLHDALECLIDLINKPSI